MFQAFRVTDGQIAFEWEHLTRKLADREVLAGLVERVTFHN